MYLASFPGPFQNIIFKVGCMTRNGTFGCGRNNTFTTRSRSILSRKLSRDIAWPPLERNSPLGNTSTTKRLNESGAALGCDASGL